MTTVTIYIYYSNISNKLRYSDLPDLGDNGDYIFLSQGEFTHEEINDELPTEKRLANLREQHRKEVEASEKRQKEIQEKINQLVG